MALTDIRIADLLGPHGREGAAHLDSERVAWYAERLDSMPPIVVFETDGGSLIADGHHRVAAARQRGAETIVAEVRRGSPSDALRCAAAIAAAQRGISREEALARIKERSPHRWGRE